MPSLDFGLGHRPLSLKGSPRRPFYMDNLFTLVQVDTVLRKCNKPSAPGPDNVSFQALRDLDELSPFQLLQRLNLAWSSGAHPAEPKHALVKPMLKRCKPRSALSCYCPIPLT